MSLTFRGGVGCDGVQKTLVPGILSGGDPAKRNVTGVPAEGARGWDFPVFGGTAFS